MRPTAAVLVRSFATAAPSSSSSSSAASRKLPAAPIRVVDPNSLGKVEPKPQSAVEAREELALKAKTLVMNTRAAALQRSFDKQLGLDREDVLEDMRKSTNQTKIEQRFWLLFSHLLNFCRLNTFVQLERCNEEYCYLPRFTVHRYAFSERPV